MTTNFGAAGNELRARWNCQELADRYGLDAVPAYDQDGSATGWIAVDPAALEDHLYAYAEEGDEIDDGQGDGAEEDQE
ncbi:hypothetical protein EV652_10318 [Kribbella steppae]|uniref:Uncharacterized protein n=1 Tax=Kribbella steppae TaxID=2512223 RepID=A0A4R2HPX5_9ACTN|nr:hypothetical protein [Kribbella steppae]TCO33019.1 hypothetical protein EV652_10318 [Kribbella steppae]